MFYSPVVNTECVAVSDHVADGDPRGAAILSGELTPSWLRLPAASGNLLLLSCLVPGLNYLNFNLGLILTCFL